VVAISLCFITVEQVRVNSFNHYFEKTTHRFDKQCLYEKADAQVVGIMTMPGRFADKIFDAYT
jgi:hypothetical protein